MPFLARPRGLWLALAKTAPVLPVAACVVAGVTLALDHEAGASAPIWPSASASGPNSPDLGYGPSARRPKGKAKAKQFFDEDQEEDVVDAAHSFDATPDATQRPLRRLTLPTGTAHDQRALTEPTAAPGSAPRGGGNGNVSGSSGWHGLGLGANAQQIGVNSILTNGIPQPSSSAPLRLSGNVADVLQHMSAPLSYPQLPGASPGTWNGQGSMPGGFVAPWSFGSAYTSDFDPSFKTSYWSQAGGFVNSADAPWNTGMVGATGYGPMIFSRGLAYAGRPDYSQLNPIWNADSPALRANSGATRAL